MPVVVVGGSNPVGTALVPLLLERSPEVRALVRRREDAGGLRALGAKVAVEPALEPDALATLFHDAHTVCHLAGGLRLANAEAYEEANLRTVERVIEGARAARVARILLLSTTGADPEETNAYLRAKGRAEEAVRGSGLQHVVLRVTRIVAPASPWFRDVAALASQRWPVVVGDGTQVLAPVAAADAAAALAAADDRAGEVAATLALEGPHAVSADGLADLLSGKRRRKRHVDPSGRRAARVVGGDAGPDYLDLLARDARADAADASRDYGIERTRLDRAVEWALRRMSA